MRYPWSGPLLPLCLTIVLTYAAGGSGSVAAVSGDAEPLPVPRLTGGRPLMQALSLRQTAREFRPEPLPPEVVGEMLWAAFGVNRAATGGRTVASAMNAQEIDLYLTTKEGVFRYNAQEHVLQQQSSLDVRGLTGGGSFSRVAPVSLVYVADERRQQRAPAQDRQTYAAITTGGIMQNVYLFAASEGLATVVHELDRGPLAKALELGPGQRIVLAQAVGYPMAEQVVPPGRPLDYDERDAIEHRWRGKPVQSSRLLDDAEELTCWEHRGVGALALTSERAFKGEHALRLTAPTKGDSPGKVMGRPFGNASAVRVVANEDWTRFNRISFRVYPDLPGFKVISLCAVLHNDGEEKVPGPYHRNGLNFILLEPNQWNHCVWEIAHLGRDRVTGVEFQYRQQGNEPGATDQAIYDFDQIELEVVEADHFEGWAVAEGRMAFSHTGYQLGYRKTALASGLKAKEFTLLDASSGKVVLRAPIQTEAFPIGTFQILDFSEVERPGTYTLQAGERVTRPFRIGADVWRRTLEKTLNLYYTERCGDAVPGIHDVCHRDWVCVHGDNQIVINGGWHDAGDLSQGLVNTAESAYAMLALAEARQKSDPGLARQLIAEAGWGVDWMLKGRFGDGYRCTWATMDFWTDGIMGTVDDVTAKAGNGAFENYLAASTEALSARLLRDYDRLRAEHCLKAALADWEFGRANVRGDRLDIAAACVNASLDLYEATQLEPFAEEAIKLAGVILACQERELRDWEIPLRGFFYTGPLKQRILHYSHRGHEQAPVVGLVRLCRLFPDHPGVDEWRRALELYCEYYLTVAKYTQPYGMIPAGIYSIEESDRLGFKEQVRSGVWLDAEHTLRRFPVWYDFRGNHGTTLSQALGLAVAGRFLENDAVMELVQQQLQWVVGRNPFCQSTMWGEGYDFAPQYTAMSGNLVGSLPVGVQTHFDRDVPYWPAENCYNWKEVWVHPSARWLAILAAVY